ncbi:MAG: glycosyltransferase family 39 protein [Bacteroidia bacterium]|nr:glycosyltransferase family 39 protein [Bacteroidia bacterium]MBP9690253.1 glycosyltransferase family 39 protein [Bacteroidia bacterium]
MVDHKISLLPSAVPDYISFGHPLLLFFINALWVKMFGFSPLAFHSLSILITLCTAFGTYLLASQITKNYVIGILAFVIFLFQPIVIAQSTQVLLEMLLTCTIVFAIFFYLKNQFVYSAIVTSFAVLTKETGLVLAVALPFSLIIKYMFFDKSKLLIKGFIWYLIPFAVFAIFLIIQHQTFGWYLNPNNLGATKITFNSITQRAWDYALKFVWLKQGRWLFTLVSVLFLINFIIKNKSKIKLTNSIILLVVFSFGFMLFSSIASCLHRYFLVMMPIVSLAFAIVIFRVDEMKKYAGVVLLVIGLILNLYFLNDNTQNSEVNLSYRNQIKVNVLLFDYLNQPEFTGEKVKIDFPVFEATQDARYGYTMPTNYQAVKFVNDAVANYYVYTQPGNWSDAGNQTDSLSLIHKITVNNATALIFSKR